MKTRPIQALYVPIITAELKSAVAGALAGIGFVSSISGALVSTLSGTESQGSDESGLTQLWTRVAPAPSVESDSVSKSIRVSLDPWVEAFRNGSQVEPVEVIENSYLPVPNLKSYIPRARSNHSAMRDVSSKSVVQGPTAREYEVYETTQWVQERQQEAWAVLGFSPESATLKWSSIPTDQWVFTSVGTGEESPSASKLPKEKLTTLEYSVLPPARLALLGAPHTPVVRAKKVQSFPVVPQESQSKQAETLAAVDTHQPRRSLRPESSSVLNAVAPVQSSAVDAEPNPTPLSWDELLERRRVWDSFQVSSQMPFYGEQVAGATARVFAADGDHQSTSHAWIMTDGGYSLPTIQWVARRDLEQVETVAIRALSENSASLLAALKGTALRPQTGVVFGKVPSGYSVALVGDSTSPLYLTSDGREAIHFEPGMAKGDLWFAFVNTQPGAAQVLMLDSHSQEPQGVVTAPVIAGGATFLSLDFPMVRSLRVNVLDAGSSQRRPMVGASVRVVGWSELSIQSDSNGLVQLESLPQVGSYPLYVEVTPRGGFPHRYRAAVDRSNIQAWVFSESRVKGWIDQLEGGVDPRSGLVVGAVNLSGENRSELGSIHVKSFVREESGFEDVLPEVYQWIDGEDSFSEKGQQSGYLTPDLELSRYGGRFVATQLLPGSHQITAFEDRTEKAQWSHWVISSPGVVQVVNSD